MKTQEMVLYEICDLRNDELTLVTESFEEARSYYNLRFCG